MNESIRQQFPALQRIHNGKPFIFLDGPAGTQVPQIVIDAISDYYKTSNANTHGQFVTTQETDIIMETTRNNIAAFIGAEGGHTISFGQNMTSLNFSLSRAIGKVLQPGDEILITQLDHESNRGPWLALREKGIVVREVRLLGTGILDYEDFAQKINERTRLVAMGYASNILGTINDVQLIRKLTYQVGAWLLLDAVHYAPHLPLDVQALGCDFLLCSAYKFYGPHVGILYSKPGLLDRLPADRLRTTYQHAPYSIETGTLNHAAIAGVDAAIKFIASVGKGENLSQQLKNAMQQIGQHERRLVQKLYDNLLKIKGIRIFGPPMDVTVRAPTLAITVEGKRPDEVCRFLAQRNICAWDGHFYAIRSTEVLGLLEQGGVTRLGISIYTTEQEIKDTLEAFSELD
ncbi:MAG: cysteine desulfurase-like protein [Saprospiraceae bacterium]|nr:cysteine desulfurase-like protein [Saprospiraceae bacterium]